MGFIGRACWAAGVAFYISNLSGIRAAIAGALGGLVAVAGFFALTHIDNGGNGTPDVLERPQLGCAIGMMVGLLVGNDVSA